MSDQFEALEQRIRKVEDFQSITNLQAQYSLLVDAQQMDKLVELFAEDFVWEVGVEKMVRISSKPELLEYLGTAGAGNAMMRHQVLTPYIELDGDKAKGTWYMFGPGTSIMQEGEVANWTQGTYSNEYVREKGVWKISLLSFKYNFRTPYEDGWVKTPMITEAWSRR